MISLTLFSVMRPSLALLLLAAQRSRLSQSGCMLIDATLGRSAESLPQVAVAWISDTVAQIIITRDCAHAVCKLVHDKLS
jgi:hypothetical protein